MPRSAALLVFVADALAAEPVAVLLPVADPEAVVAVASAVARVVDALPVAAATALVVDEGNCEA
jgi:hypothetical protein